jgi:phospholipid-binding lipoprotein MlaA
MSSARIALYLSVIFVMLGGCASHPSAPPGQRSAADPWEPLNRQIDGFNTALDKVTLKPVAKGYKNAVPQIIRTGVGNFSSNLRTPLNIVNKLLQGKGKESLSETGRLLANTTFGLLGLVDVAADMGLEPQNEDFGQTLAVWGVPSGPYVVIPLLGPSTLRDALMMPLNILADPLLYYDNAPVRDKVYGLRLIDARAGLLSAEKLLEGSTDRYITLRESYLQNRRYVIYDGNPPQQDDFYDDSSEEAPQQ